MSQADLAVGGGQDNQEIAVSTTGNNAPKYNTLTFGGAPAGGDGGGSTAGGGGGGGASWNTAVKVLGGVNDVFDIGANLLQRKCATKPHGRGEASYKRSCERGVPVKNK